MAGKKKVVLKLDMLDDKEKRAARKAVSTLKGVDKVTVDMKDRKLTVIGVVDPVDVVGKLRKNWPSAQILSVGQLPEKDEKKGEKKPPKPWVYNPYHYPDKGHKAVLKLDLHDDKETRAALKAVFTVEGIDQLAVDMKDRKMTVIGVFDLDDVVGKLRKNWPSVELLSDGQLPEKKEEKKDEKKDEKKPEPPKPWVYYPSRYPQHAYRYRYRKPQPPKPWWVSHPYHYPQHAYPYPYPQYLVRSAEEDPNSCVIC